MNTTIKNQPNPFVTEMPVERLALQQTPLQPPLFTRRTSTAVPSGKKRKLVLSPVDENKNPVNLAKSLADVLLPAIKV